MEEILRVIRLLVLFLSCLFFKLSSNIFFEVFEVKYFFLRFMVFKCLKNFMVFLVVNVVVESV